jgi:ribonuclease HII
MTQGMARYRIGADENGLGPRLGPMLVTAVLAEVTDEGWSTVGKKPRGGLAERLGDSKAMVAYGDVALAEAWARALVERGAGRADAGSAPVRTPDELVHRISLDDRATLRAPCPSHVEAQCWGTAGEAFSAPDELVRTIHKDLDRLSQKGVTVTSVRSVILCSERLNAGLSAGKNRFVMDLHAMERLILALRDQAGAEVSAVCGKVGGFGKYGGVFGPLSGRMHVVMAESRDRSAYRFPGLGEIAFVKDGDASDLLVSLASMVGKYLREVLMARVVRHWQALVPDLRGASGYHDPVTAAFVDATRLSRQKLRVPDDCFERRGARGDAEV